MPISFLHSYIIYVFYFYVLSTTFELCSKTSLVLLLRIILIFHFFFLSPPLYYKSIIHPIFIYFQNTHSILVVLSLNFICVIAYCISIHFKLFLFLWILSNALNSQLNSVTRADIIVKSFLLFFS